METQTDAITTRSTGTQTQRRTSRRIPVAQPSPPTLSIDSFLSGPPHTKGPRTPLLTPVVPASLSGTDFGRNPYSPDHPDNGAFLRATVGSGIFPYKTPYGGVPSTPPPSRRTNARTSSNSDMPAQHYKFKPNEWSRRSEMSEASYHTARSHQSSR
jgi:hypothetical protein